MIAQPVIGIAVNLNSAARVSWIVPEISSSSPPPSPMTPM